MDILNSFSNNVTLNILMKINFTKYLNFLTVCLIIYKIVYTLSLTKILTKIGSKQIFVISKTVWITDEPNFKCM